MSENPEQTAKNKDEEKVKGITGLGLHLPILHENICIEVFSFHLLSEDTNWKCILIATCSANGYPVLFCHFSPQIQLILHVRPNIQIEIL